MDLMEIKKARAKVLAIGSNYGIEKIYVIGSVDRQENTPESDLDFLIEMRDSVSLFGVGGFIYDVGKLLGVEVDAIPLSVLSQIDDHEFVQKVQSEAVPL